MQNNPYKFSEPLDPNLDEPVCIQREETVNKIIEGVVFQNDYWVIYGSNYSGKTTLFKLIKANYPRAHYVYVDFNAKPGIDKTVFYAELYRSIIKETASNQSSLDLTHRYFQGDNPDIQFFKLLRQVTFSKPGKKIILFFDNIEYLSFYKDFLILWRKIFIERQIHGELKKYSVIITGPNSLIALTIGTGSPFNIAKTMYLSDFTTVESCSLIDKPLQQMGISIEPDAREFILNQVAGHPQMLQHLCHILVEKTVESGSKGIITIEDVQNAIDILLGESHCLRLLQQDIETNEKLKSLLTALCQGEKKKFLAYQEFSTFGAGAVVEKNYNCVFRNPVYERFIRDFLKIPS